jgi:hypothetical protein
LTGDEPHGAELRTLEEHVEGLTEEIARLINTAPAEVRKDLRDFAIGLLREGVEDAPRLAPARPAGTAFNPLGIAIPLLLVGAMVIFLFPPVGLVVFALAGVMLAWGVVASLLSR